jgi:hypothetical protein
MYSIGSIMDELEQSWVHLGLANGIRLTIGDSVEIFDPDDRVSV